jgi:hypothetical protein
MWNQVGLSPIKVVAASNICCFAGKSLLAPDTYAGKAVGIAGDELNFEQACNVFKEWIGDA